MNSMWRYEAVLLVVNLSGVQSLTLDPVQLHPRLNVPAMLKQNPSKEITLD